MDFIFDLKTFWSSLITEKGIAPHVESLMKIVDVEERGLALMSRVFFLWCMGLKFEREDVQDKLQKIQDIINKSNGGFTACKKCSDIRSILTKQNHHDGGSENNSRQTGDNYDLNSLTPKRKRQELSPNQVKKLRKFNKENEDCSPEKLSPIEILAPETEIELFTQKLIDEKHALVIPETIPVDEFCYGNTDFFQDSPKCNSPTAKIKKSPVLGKVKAVVTPIQNKSKALKCLTQSSEHFTTNLSPEKSPEKTLLEKSAMLKSPESTNKFKTLKSLMQSSEHFATNSSPEKSPEKTLNEKSTLLKSPDSTNCSPSLLSCNRNMILRNSPKKMILQNSPKKNLTSPFKDKQKNIPSSIESDFNSKKSPINLVKVPLSSHSPITLQTATSYQTRKLLSKSRSEVRKTISNRLKLSRIKTLTSLKSTRPHFEINLDSPTPNKNYRQTKITKDSFKPPKTNVVKLTGGKCSPVKVVLDDDDEAIAKAIEESIHTKEIEDILRKKHKQLDKDSSGKLKKFSMEQKKVEPSVDHELRTSPCSKNQKLSSLAGPSGVSSQVSVEEVLADLENDSGKQKKEEKPNRLRRNKKKTILQDSFDMLPDKDDELPYAYKGNVARKNHDKKRLEGWDCHECRNYYEAKGISNQERKDLQNKCSRHRSKYKPVTNTPEGFWVLGWSDDEHTDK